MDKKYLRIAYKHYDLAELEVQPKSKFIKSMMTNNETVKYDFELCFEVPKDISEDKIKELCSCYYNLILKQNNLSKKASSAEIRKFNEDFVAFGTTEFLPHFGFKLLSVEQEKTLKEEDILTLTIVNPKSRFWKNSQELKDFYSWVNSADKKLINKLNRINNEENTF